MRLYPEQGLVHTREFLDLLARPDHGQIDVNLIAAIRVQAEVAGYRLFSSYHCSRLNTNTGRLTTPMFEAVVGSIADFLGK